MIEHRRMRLRILSLLIAVVPAAGCTHSPTAIGPPPGSIAPRTPTLKSFDLTDQDGKPFSSRSLKGDPWVGCFFFTQCPSVCWRMNQSLAKWQADHSQSAFKFVSITCDPQTDTPAALKLYADHFKADPRRWIFLTGDMPYISKVGRDFFRLAVERGTHSSRVVVFDRKGEIRGSFDIADANQFKKCEALLAEIEAEA